MNRNIIRKYVILDGFEFDRALRLESPPILGYGRVIKRRSKRGKVAEEAANKDQPVMGAFRIMKKGN